MKYQAGSLDSDGIFRVWIKSTQVLQVASGGGILEETIQDLSGKPEWRGIEITVTDGQYRGVYVYTRDQVMGMRTWKSRFKPNSPSQRVFPLTDKYKRGEQK